MKKTIIATLIGAIILFVYTFLSWMVLPIHKNTLKYTKAQDTLMSVISANLTENGMYGLPTAAPGMNMEEQQKAHENMVGKPMAMLMYNKSFPGLTPGMLILSVLFNVISVLFAVVLLNAAKPSTAGKRWWLVMVFPVVILCQSRLYDMTFWQYPWHYVSGEVIDAILGWALVGIWLAWYLGRSAKTV